MRGLTIDLRTHDDVVVASLNGEIDLVNHEQAGAEILTTALDSGPRLVIDFQNVSYVDSNGVRMLFGVARELDHSRVEWTVALGEQSPLKALFKVTTFDEVARVFETLEDALGALSGQG
ncbi:MAG TPA: STAS domain-containing protein [Acidimicrobiales bacterium]|nr:STAS domain-containing protein [Acidimicrobiales bacterium]